MPEEKKPGAAQKFLADHGEKVGLGAAAVALVAYLIVGVLMAEEDPGAAKLNDQIARINRERAAAHADRTPPEPKPWQERAVGPWNTIATTAAGADPWSATFISDLKPDEKAPIVIKDKIALIPSIAFDRSAVELDNVTISWTLTEFTKAEIKKGEKEGNVYPPLSHFKVERKTGGSETWETLAETLPKDVTTFKDEKIDPKTTYGYRITSFCTDPLYTKKNPGGKGQAVETPEPILTLGIWNVEFSNAMKGMVYVRIEKFDKGHGKKFEVKHIHNAGDRIGWWGKTPASEPVSMHGIQDRGRLFQVDFNCGMTLESVEPIQITLQVLKCDPKYNKEGQVVSCTPKEEPEVFSNVYEIVYADAEGSHKVYSPDPAKDRRSQPQMTCPIHRPLAPPSKAAGGKEGAAEVPVETPAQRREREAIKLYQDVEQLIEKGKPEKAIPLLEKLLKEYATTDYVSKEKRIVIEARLAMLKEKK